MLPLTALSECVLVIIYVNISLRHCVLCLVYDSGAIVALNFAFISILKQFDVEVNCNYLGWIQRG